MKLKRIISRWNEIKELINSDEFFLGVSYNHKNNIVKYNFLSNTKRKIFWKFIDDYVKTNSEE